MFSMHDPALRDVHRTREQVTALLRARDITPTHQRIEIAHAIFSHGGHLSADGILALVNGRSSETSKATVYNTLSLFLEKKLVREVIADPQKVFYDANTAPHYHFYNVDTGELTDIDARDIQVIGLPELPAGLAAEGIDIVVRVRATPA